MEAEKHSMRLRLNVHAPEKQVDENRIDGKRRSRARSKTRETGKIICPVVSRGEGFRFTLGFYGARDLVGHGKF